VTGLRVLLEDRLLVESPRWHDDRLLFSDWGAGELVAVDLNGHAEVVANVALVPFCIDRLPDGRLVVVSNSQLLRREDDGDLVVHADLSDLSTKPWNDIVVDGRGNIYVNNIGFDFPGGEFAPGLIALVTPDGSVRQVADGLAFPNGMAVSQDNRTLVVAESYAGKLTGYQIQADGSLAGGHVWAELGENAAPDGICLDAENAAWYASVPGRHCVRVAKGGEVLQTVEADRGCFACTLGGPDGRTLFVVGARWPDAMEGKERTGQVLATEVNVPAAGWPR
jgi:sugar lactone lactonase YvrE